MSQSVLAAFQGRSRLLVMLSLMVIGVLLYVTGAFETEVWVRTQPIANPIKVDYIHDGVLCLEDGRTLRPAGISRRDDVTAAVFDDALRIMTAQGIVIERQVDHGSAFCLVEPRFYNWCGTRGHNGNPFARLAGVYRQCPLSVLLIQSGFARADVQQPGLSEIDQWRLSGVAKVFDIDRPAKLQMQLNALPITNEVRFAEYDYLLQQHQALPK